MRNGDTIAFNSGYAPGPHGSGVAERKDPNRDLKICIWIYFLLLIFEGALRKWFLPQLATPLLVVRDPIALFVVLAAWYRGMLPKTVYLIAMVIIGVTAIFTALLLGHGNLWIALFGARILLIHFPLMFAIGRVFTRRDVIHMGKVTIWLMIPLAVLLVLQFYSPQSAWVNRGVGGNFEGAGFSGALGYFRPSTTFSFTNGTTLFFGFGAAFLFYFWLASEKLNRVLLICASGALVLAIPLSISRALFFGVAVSLVFAMVAIARKPAFLARTIFAGLALTIAIFAIGKVEIFQTGLEVFMTRFENANETEGGLDGVFVDRYLGDLIKPFLSSSGTPFFGWGLGLGTNAGSMLAKGEVQYLIAEEEWSRLIGELGPLMGFLVVALRLGLAAKIGIASYTKLAKGDLLPWLMLSFGFLILVQGQWGQPTSLGFCVVISGLMLASMRTEVEHPARAVMHDQKETNLTVV